MSSPTSSLTIPKITIVVSGMIVANGLFVDMAGILCNTALNVKNTFVTLVNYNIVTIGRKLSALYLVDFR